MLFLYHNKPELDMVMDLESNERDAGNITLTSSGSIKKKKKTEKVRLV